MEVYELEFNVRYKNYESPPDHWKRFGTGNFGLFATRELAIQKIEKAWPEYQNFDYWKSENDFREEWFVQRSGWNDETKTKWEDGDDIRATIYKHKVQGTD